MVLDPYRPSAGATRAKYRLMELQSLNWTTLGATGRGRQEGNRQQEGPPTRTER